MKVFKFGGASVKDAASVKNVAEIMKTYADDQLVVIVSAMGKTTNALEDLISLYFEKGDWKSKLEEIKQFHMDIANGLFDEEHLVFARIEAISERIIDYLDAAEGKPYVEVYSELVSQGELLSTRIIRNYLNDYVHKSICLMPAIM